MSERPSMREILEAARRGTPAPPKNDAAEPPAADPEPPKKPLSMAEKLAAARGEAKPADAPKKPLSMAEKLAAARGTAPEPAETKDAEPPAAPAAPVAPPPSAEVAATREMADALRRAGAKKDEEAASRPPVAPPVGVRLPFSPTDHPEAATPSESPSRSQLHLDHRGVLVFASWTAIGRTALLAAAVVATWMMIGFLFPGADSPP